MKLIPFAISLSTLLSACLIESPTPPPSQALPPKEAASTAGTSGARFIGRTDRGEERALALQKLAVAVTTRPGTVRSHLTMEVSGPANERVEAVMRLGIPRGAAVTRAVLWVNGRPMNGAFVQRDRAQQIYRSIVERRRDPALVTWDGPGWVAVSIFPLERGEARRFELEWVEPAAIDGGFLQYRVPAIAEAGRVVGRPTLQVDGHPLAIAGRDVVPLAPAPPDAARVVSGRAPGDPFQRLLARTTATESAPRFLLVAETSEAMSPADRVSQRAAIGTLLAALSPTARLTLVAADWAVSTLADDVAPEEARRALAKLDGIVSAGALHLERALGDAAARAHKSAGAAVLFVGRGVDGFGGDALRAPLAALRDGGIRLSIVATGEVPPPLADAAALTGGEAMSTRALEGDLGALVDALKPRPARPVGGAARGTEDWRPLETITGQTVWVGRAREVPSPLDGTSEAVASADPADLLPLWDRARIVGAEGGGSAGADRSVPSALTPLRSLLVLETESDYAHYGLATPERIAGLRQVGDGGKMGKRLAEEQAKNAGILGVLQQTEGSRPTTGLTADTLAENSGNGVRGGLIGNTISGEGTMGVGNLSTIGTIGGGHGSYYGRGVGGLGGRRARAPDVVPGTASVRGALDKEIVRRIIRRHIGEVRYCYEAELLRRPSLGGRVLVQFTIAASGQVVASGLQNSTLGNNQVDRCIVEAVRRWDFPRPLDGGIVIVSYPFVLTPADIAADATSPFSVSPAPDRTAMDALTLLAGRGELGDRVARIASLLGLDRTSDPESLAWMIDRQSASLSEITLVARLLVAAKRDSDAVRVLSESAQAEPAKIAAELRHMNAPAAATEVLALAKRGR